jgi:hypothetical protein
MESNGMPNRIHCSETTANLLRLAGVANWIEPRADTIVAKGKGKMQTYWVLSQRGGRSASGLTVSSSSIGEKLPSCDDPPQSPLTEKAKTNEVLVDDSSKETE